MAQNITLLGASYSDVPAVDLPKTGGGTARFADASVTTAVAEDVASGKVFLLADGSVGTGSASGGGGIDLFDPATPSGAVISSFSGATKSYACTERSEVTSIHLVNATSIGSYSIYNNSDLATVVGEKSAGTGNYGLAKNANLTTVDILARNTSSTATIGNNAFNNDGKLNTIILRGVYVITLGGTGAFTGTPFASDGTGGTLYVPQALISDYQSATNWSTILGYANNQIKKIESSIYETQYADGTPIG